MEKLQQWIDKITVAISAIMIAMMMIILIINIILRYTPGVGGVKWYMESTQYLNVWAMLIVGIAICVKNEHLNVNVLPGLLSKKGNKVLKVIVAFLNILFYLGLGYGGYLLATKSKQVISTMPMFKMSYVYWMIPICSLLSILSIIIAIAIDLKKKDKEIKGAQK